MRSQLSNLALAVSACLILPLAGCGGSSSDSTTGGSSGGGGGGGGTVNLARLSGLVRTSGGDPLENVTVSVGTVEALTDATGAFLLASIGSLPVGEVLVEFDGATATPTGPIPFPLLDVLVPLPAGTTALAMPRVITLPDLNNQASANQNLDLNADGTAAEPILVAQSNGMMDLSLSGQVGTLVTIGGMVGAVGVDLNMTPVDSSEVPMPLDDGLLGNGFVTIQPGNAAFDQPGPATGLDIVMPDTLGLPVGTMLDIWSFDHDAAMWVNRTAETGQSGVVQLAGGTGPGTEVVATGVITEGGWHASVVPVDPDCGTRLMGRVIDNATGAGIGGASIAFATGQFAVTSPDGTFLSDLLPAYDVGRLLGDGDCIAAEICFEIVLPPTSGGLSSGKLTVGAADVVSGGTTEIDPYGFTLGTTGTLAGVVLGAAADGELVNLTPAAGPGRSVLPNASGAFFATGLEAGPWTASYLFAGEPAPTEVPFSIVANMTTTIVIQMAKGGGDGDFTVLVLQDDETNASIVGPVEGASVRLQGTDSGSAAGLVMITDADGRARFDSVTGPFTVTAQKDMFFQGETTRYATSLVGINPPTDTIGLLMSSNELVLPPVPTATIEGAVLNLPAMAPGQFDQITASVTGTEGLGFIGAATPDPVTGAYSIPVPNDTPVDLAFFRRDGLLLSASLIEINVGQVATGGTLTVDLDYASTSLWDQPVTINFSGASAGATVSVLLRLVHEATGSGFSAPLIFGAAGSSSGMANLPDLSDAAFAGYRVFLGGLAFDATTDNEQTCQQLLTSTPASFDIDFRGLPTLTSPMEGASFTVADLEALQVTFIAGSDGPFGGQGADIFSLSYDSGSGGTPPPGIDAMVWDVFVRVGDTAFALPLATLPMFGAGQGSIYAELEQSRFQGGSLDYDSFFSANLGANVDMLLNGSTGQCFSGVEHVISTQ